MHAERQRRSLLSGDNGDRVLRDSGARACRSVSTTRVLELDFKHDVGRPGAMTGTGFHWNPGARVYICNAPCAIQALGQAARIGRQEEL
jgi:hypothetical protein